MVPTFDKTVSVTDCASLLSLVRSPRLLLIRDSDTGRAEPVTTELAHRL